MKHGGKKDVDVTDFRYALVEFDLDEKGNPIPKEIQFALILKFDLPVVSLVDSGGKSLHAIIHVDATDRMQFNERLKDIHSLFPVHSIDLSNKNPSRYSRLPGFPRENGNEPRLLAIQLGPADYASWIKQRSKNQSDFENACVFGAAFLSLSIPPKKVIIDDWLKEGELGYIYAFRGTGKSWFVIYFCVQLALGKNFGPWAVKNPCRVMYVDGEMSYDDNCTRAVGLAGEIPENLHILNHGVFFQLSGGKSMNFADTAHQQEILAMAIRRNIKVIVLDNASCLFTGIRENKQEDWDARIKNWILDIRRHGISVIIVSHTGYDTTHMRGHSGREDSSSWGIRLDNKKESEDEGAKFVSRFTKYRGQKVVLDYDWIFDPKTPATPAGIAVCFTPASRAETLLQWVRDGLTSCEDIAREMGISKGQVSKMATQLIRAGKLTKRGRDYEVV